MQNITLQSMVNEFSFKNNISDTDSLKFEKFVNYSLLSNDYFDSFNLDDVSTGNCVGVDALGISLNGILVYSEKEAKAITGGQFDAKFYFIQSKTSHNLDLGDYLKFLNTVSLFFTGKESDQPAELIEAFKIKTHIYEKASRFRESPELLLTYVYTGKGKIENPGFESQVTSKVNLIRDLPYLFSNTVSRLVGSNELANQYKETLNRTTKKLIFQRHIALPKLSGATAAYLGVAKCLDYIEILKNQQNSINKGVFYDNVRDYLGSSNNVNADIEETIKSVAQRNLFSVLNNGVTLVAKKVSPSGDNFEISGFQVVNGCQTSHVLFHNKDIVTDDMYITIKLIETDDIDLSSSVIKSTNSQSVVMKEAFATIKPYHKKLEDFFNAMSQEGRQMYYERRPHQYDDDEKITTNKIVSAPTLIKSFVSVVIEEPHKVHFYYGQILRDYNTDKTTLLFDDDHHPALYYISQLLTSKCKDHAIKNKVNLWTYHLALLVKLRLGLKLSIEEGIVDSRIPEIISLINNNFKQAFSDALSVLQNTKLLKNDHMLPKKTDAILENFRTTYPIASIFNEQKYKSAPITPATSQPQNNASEIIATNSAVLKSKASTTSTAPSNSSVLYKIEDGIYMVKNISITKDYANFSYGPKKYTIANTMNLDNIKYKESAKIFIVKSILVLVQL